MASEAPPTALQSYRASRRMLLWTPAVPETQGCHTMAVESRMMTTEHTHTQSGSAGATLKSPGKTPPGPRNFSHVQPQAYDVSFQFCPAGTISRTPEGMKWRLLISGPVVALEGVTVASPRAPQCPAGVGVAGRCAPAPFPVTGCSRNSALKEPGGWHTCRVPLLSRNSSDRALQRLAATQGPSRAGTTLPPPCSGAGRYQLRRTR